MLPADACVILVGPVRDEPMPGQREPGFVRSFLFAGYRALASSTGLSGRPRARTTSEGPDRTLVIIDLNYLL